MVLVPLKDGLSWSEHHHIALREYYITLTECVHACRVRLL